MEYPYKNLKNDLFICKMLYNYNLVINRATWVWLRKHEMEFKEKETKDLTLSHWKNKNQKRKRHLCKVYLKSEQVVGIKTSNIGFSAKEGKK